MIRGFSDTIFLSSIHIIYIRKLSFLYSLTMLSVLTFYEMSRQTKKLCPYQQVKMAKKLAKICLYGIKSVSLQ